MIANAIRLLSALAMMNLATLALAGDLNPPGAPASTPGPEPRIAINQENTPGDASAEFRITETGSYYLEDNIIVLGTEVKHGIVIESSDVTLDLNGFTVDGYTFSTAPHMNLSLTGILASGDLESITVRNGVVRDWGEWGVDLHSASDTLVEGVLAIHNTDDGIRSGENSTVTRCVANRNGRAGIRASTGTTVSDCTVMENGRDGIVVNRNSHVHGCSVADNTASGIYIGSADNRIEGNAVMGNDEKGIELGVFVIGTAVTGNSVTGSGGDGIHIGITSEDNAITHNTACNNTGYGINDASTLPAGNPIYGNVGSGNLAGDYASSVFLVVTNPTTSTGPWANISH